MSKQNLLWKQGYRFTSAESTVTGTFSLSAQLSESSCCVIAGSQLDGLCGALKPNVSWHSLGRWAVMCTVAVAHAEADEWLVWIQTQSQINQSSAHFPLKQHSVLCLINSSDSSTPQCYIQMFGMTPVSADTMRLWWAKVQSVKSFKVTKTVL